MTTAACDCGHARIEVEGTPLLRFICHCTLCQRFNKAPSADMAVFRARDVVVADPASVSYERLRKGLAVDRGRCAACAQPIVEYLRAPLMPAIVFVPAERLEGLVDLEPPALRVFYDSRVEDAQDELPRYQGYWPSQLAVTRRLLPALMRHSSP